MKRSAHSSIDVNLEELDRIIDRGMRVPLSESDGQKLKAVLHALVEKAAPQWRTTEKTRAVLETTQPPSPAAPHTSPEKVEPAGHGRNGAAVFKGSRKVSVPHLELKPGDRCPECGEGKVYRQKEPKTLVRIVGQTPLGAC